MAKKFRNSQSKSFYIEIIIAIVFLSIIAAVVMLVYSRTNHIIYVNGLKDEAINLSSSYIECVKSGMDKEKALDAVFLDRGYKISECTEQGQEYIYKVISEDITCDITLKETIGNSGVYTEINMKYTSYFGELYEIDGGVYKSINEKGRVSSNEKE